jgi:hypothetical protein
MFDRQVTTFWRNSLFLSSGSTLKMEAACSSEVLVLMYKPTQYYITGVCNLDTTMSTSNLMQCVDLLSLILRIRMLYGIYAYREKGKVVLKSMRTLKHGNVCDGD